MSATILLGEVQVGPCLFEFMDFADWVNHAKRRYAFCWVATVDTICIDNANRICNRGAHFMRARDENAFPVRVYAIDAIAKCYPRKPPAEEL